MSDTSQNINTTDDNSIVLDDNQIVCMLTNRQKTASDKELTLQSMIAMMIDEYGFAPEDMERDFKLKYTDLEGKSRSQKIDLAIFNAGKAHDADELIRFVIVAKNATVKPSDAKAGVVATTNSVLESTNCEFACWTNGEDLQYIYCKEDDYGNVGDCINISDFPAKDQTLEDLENQSERAIPRKPANESLIRTFKRCHNYIYANEGMKKTAFWELLNLIFCKLYDEKRLKESIKKAESYHRRFWVGVTEQNSEEGLKNVAARIKSIFVDLKESEIYKDVFDGNEAILLSDRGLAYVAGELSKYSFLDASVDVKGTAYETIVSNTLKQEAGQFFTPRNIIKCMVQMLDPDEDTRILDPACGSGGFLVTALDHVRKKIAKKMFPDLDELHLEEMYNSPEVDDRVRAFAENKIFGFDFDPDLKKAARMNMVMAGDGHSNIFNINSLEYPAGAKPDVPLVAKAVNLSIQNSADKNFDFNTAEDNAQGKFDMVFTNPPFGAKVEVDTDIANKFELASRAPEILFIEACYNFLKPGGKMAIVLPDGILGNPNTEPVRIWILRHFKILASVDLPVETFLPQVGVQASLLFLQKKTSSEMLVSIDKEDYDVFMAIVEQVGKDRRGVPVFEKDDDGAELLFSHLKRWITIAPNGREIIRERIERIKHLADDLPKVAEAYAKFKEEH